MVLAIKFDLTQMHHRIVDVRHRPPTISDFEDISITGVVLRDCTSEEWEWVAIGSLLSTLPLL